jgi:(2Fe-2S) ferredoxin
MSKLKQQSTNFQVTGQLLDFLRKKGDKIKYLRIIIANQEYWFKPSKELRQTFDPAIVPGSWIEIEGYSEPGKYGTVKLRAEKVKLAHSPNINQLDLIATPDQPKHQQGKACILICQKSDCWKRRGQEVYQAIEANLEQQGLRDTVQIKKTGCLKQCKQGPNLVILPDKARYSCVQPENIPELITKHLQHFPFN